jgi:hypothetical protein
MLIIPKIISRVIASSLVPELYWNLALYLIWLSKHKKHLTLK